MTEIRKAELRAEVARIRQAGNDPANLARARLLEIVDEMLDTSESSARSELLLRNLMAVIFHDGGHKQDEVGTERAVTQAMIVSSGRLALLEHLTKIVHAAAVSGLIGRTEYMACNAMAIEALVQPYPDL